MPIRMEKDPNQEQNRGNNNPGDRGSRGGGMLTQILPFLLMFLFKRPKLLIPVLIIGGLWYFFSGGFNMAPAPADDTADISDFFFGASLSEEVYDKAEVFEPLASVGGFNGLPAAVSLQQYAPNRLHQGRQGSCVGWASAYAARTILHSRATGQSPNQVAFSPSYLYNQIALSGCQGAYMLDAMKSMSQNGALPFRDFRYDERTCSKEPSSSERRVGQQYKIKGYNRLTMGGTNYTPDMVAIKQNLAQGAPVVIGMQVGGSFMSRMVNQDMWIPTRTDYNMRGFSGHAMCVIGYDDNKQGGSFQIMNSWGNDWGNNGIAWVRYPDFKHFVKEAYGLYPMGSSEQYDPNKLNVEFGLYMPDSKATISLAKEGTNSFRTIAPIRKGDKFKILVANSIECYIYVFGEETDGSSYVLFPYTEKHSPYCGIVGTRLFPKDYTMVADDLGNRDRIAVVVSKKPINFNQLNTAINASSASTYVAKLNQALGSEQIKRVDYETGQTVAFEADASGSSNVVGMVVEIDKR